ncbi:MAG: hypothetical protein IJ091_05850 [Oscillospiraceae bacterium]|nr:hypothetical protein [Oscillospiraceae bacterium]
MAEYTKDKEFRRTTTYKGMDSATKKLWELYKVQNKISDDHMAEIFKLEDLRNLPKEEKQKGNRIPESLLVVTMLFFVFQMNGQSKTTITMVVTAVMVLFSAILYLSGAMNPISVAIKKSKKKLKKDYPQVPSFAEWCKENGYGQTADSDVEEDDK